MTETENISRQQSLPPARDTEQSPNLDENDSRQWETHRKRACVLVGSAILQLSIWGRSSLL